MKKIHPIILAGGSGQRLWPLSRRSFPKQFSKLVGKLTLFQQTAIRLVSSEYLDFTGHTILTNSDFRFIVGEQLNELGIQAEHTLIEPKLKYNSAILSTCLNIANSNPDALY